MDSTCVLQPQGAGRAPNRQASAPVVNRNTHTPSGHHVRTHSAGFSRQAANPVIMRGDGNKLVGGALYPLLFLTDIYYVM